MASTQKEVEASRTRVGSQVLDPEDPKITRVGEELFVRSKHHVMRIGPTSVEGHPGMLGHRVERTGKKPKKEPLPMPCA